MTVFKIARRLKDKILKMQMISILTLLCLTTLLHGQIDSVNYSLLFPKPGPYKDFYKPGKIKSDGSFANVDSIECINCYDNNLNKKISKANSKIMRVGQWKEYYENGQLKSVGTYKGIHETHSTFWIDENGKRIGQGQFAAGGVREEYVKDKTWKYYNTSGQLVREEFYFNGAIVDEDIYE